jgi:DNA-binding PadR family transcriptional regulator
MTKQAMNYLLDEMQRLGYLNASLTPRTIVQKCARLTSRGDAASQTMRQIVGQIETEIEQEPRPERSGHRRTLPIALNETGLIHNHEQ